jgi:hypothetical protein
MGDNELVDQAAQIVENFDPWWMLTFAIMLVLIDWALLHTEAFLTLGIATLLLALLNALDVPGIIQLWMYPVSIFASFLAQRKFFALITSAESPYKSLKNMGISSMQEHIGEIGTLKVLSNTDMSGDHFYSYKDEMNIEDRKIKNNDTITKTLLPNGSILPSNYVGNKGLLDGRKVRVTAIANGALVVDDMSAD